MTEITVQLEEGGPITLMDVAELERRDVVIDSEHEHTHAIEFYIPGSYARAVHRSVHVHLKLGIGIEGVLGRMG